MNLHQTELVRKSSFCLSALTHLSECLFGDELGQSVFWQLSGIISVEGWKPPTIDEMKQLITSVQRRVVQPPPLGVRLISSNALRWRGRNLELLSAM